MADDLSNDFLNWEDVPPPDATWAVILRFAGTFSAYRELGSTEAVALVARRRRKSGLKSRRLESLTELRTCLFWEARHWHWTGLGPEPEPRQMEYIRSLIERIRLRVAERNTRKLRRHPAR